MGKDILLKLYVKNVYVIQYHLIGFDTMNETFDFEIDIKVILGKCRKAFYDNINIKTHYRKCKLYTILYGFEIQYNLFENEINCNLNDIELSNKRIVHMINYLIMLYSLNNKSENWK